MKNNESIRKSINNVQFDDNYFDMDYDNFVKNTFDGMKIKNDAIAKYRNDIQNKNVLDYSQKFAENLKRFNENRQELDLKFSKRILTGVVIAITVAGIGIGFGVFAATATSIALLPVANAAAILASTMFVVGLSAIAIGAYDYFYASKLENKYQQEKNDLMIDLIKELDKKETDFLKTDYTSFRETIDKSNISQDKFNYLADLAINKILNDTSLNVNDRFNMLANFETLCEKSNMVELLPNIKFMINNNKQTFANLVSEIDQGIGNEYGSLEDINIRKNKILNTFKITRDQNNNPVKIEFTSPTRGNHNKFSNS